MSNGKFNLEWQVYRRSYDRTDVHVALLALNVCASERMTVACV
jgi:hypothetical protein